MPEIRDHKYLITAILLLSAAVHFRIIFNDFVWDDDYAIVNNEDIRSLSNIPGFFTEPWTDRLPSAEGREYRLTYSGSYYRPLALASYTIEYSLFGLNPAVSHFTNLLLHLINSLLVYLILTRFVGRMASAFAGAQFFAIHPAHTEVLNVVSYRGTLLSGTFTFLALLIFLSSKKAAARFLALPLLFTLALASKESSAVTPFVLLAASIFTGEISFKKNAAENLKSFVCFLPLFILLALYFLLRSIILTGETQSFFEGLAPVTGVLMVFKIFYHYVRLVFIPYPLSPFYDWSVVGTVYSFRDFEVIIGFLFLLASLFSFLYFLRRKPKVSLALCFFFIGLLPVSHILPFIVPFAERFLYIPLLGIALLLSIFICSLLERGMKMGTLIIAAILILPASGISFVRNGEWKNTITILEANVRDFPGSFNAHFSLGKLLIDIDRKRSEGHLKKAIVIMPGVPVTYALLATVLILDGREEEARELLKNAPQKEIVMLIMNDELTKRRSLSPLPHPSTSGE